jgi:hypothetical protein
MIGLIREALLITQSDSDVLAGDLPDVEQKNFHGCRIYDTINPKQVDKYFRIRISGSLKYIHKQTACWLLTNNRNHLSSDRLIRVRNSKKQS